MDQLEALWLVGELLGKELHKARHSLNEDRVEGLSAAISCVESELLLVDSAQALAFEQGVKSGTPSLTKTAEGVIISRG